MAAKIFIVFGQIGHTIARSILRERQPHGSKQENINQQENLADFMLKKINFSKNEARDLIQSWLSVKDDETAEWYIYGSLINIIKLESLRKGAAKYLLNNFGTRGFGRYEIDELIKQYDERDNTGPYGLFFQAVSDWNGSFNQSNQLEIIRNKVEENYFILRITEANGKIDLEKRLLSLRNKYKEKIKFMYMHIRGNVDIIGLGDGKDDNKVLLKKDLKGRGGTKDQRII